MLIKFLLLFKKDEWCFEHMEDHIKSIRYRTLFGKEYVMHESGIQAYLGGV